MPRTLTELTRHLNRRRPTGLPPLLLMTDPRQADPLAIIARLPPGSWVILRHYDDPKRAQLGQRLAKLAKQRRLVLLVAGDPQLAVQLRAGLHLPEYQLKAGRCRLAAIRRRSQPLTAACHSRRALRLATQVGAMAATLSPVFATASHPGAPCLGPLLFARLARQAALPVYALGGVRSDNVLRLRGCAGIATVGGL